MTDDGWIRVMAEGELPLGKAVRAELDDGLQLFLYRTEDRIFALDNRCTHMGGPLHRGPVRANVAQPTVTCPVHGSMFWLSDGRVVRGPATKRQPVYEARITDGMVEVRPADSIPA